MIIVKYFLYLIVIYIITILNKDNIIPKNKIKSILFLKNKNGFNKFR